MIIKINNKDRKVRFGFGATRRIVEHYGYKKPSDYAKLVKKFDLENIEDPTFEQLTFLGELFKAGILNGGGKDDFTSDDVLDVISRNPSLTPKLIKEFEKSQMQEEVVDPSKRVGN